jgi:hypothetical protein
VKVASRGPEPVHPYGAPQRHLEFFFDMQPGEICAEVVELSLEAVA